jgi:hypothetical protein
VSAQGAAALDAYKKRQAAAQAPKKQPESQPGTMYRIKDQQRNYSSRPSSSSSRSRSRSGGSSRYGTKGVKGVTSDTAVVAGFVICAIFVAAQAITGTDKNDSSDDKMWAHGFLIREVSVCILFLFLALLALAGDWGKTVATGLSILVTMSVVLNSSKLITFTTTAVNSYLYPAASKIDATPSSSSSSASGQPAPGQKAQAGSAGGIITSVTPAAGPAG